MVLGMLLARRISMGGCIFVVSWIILFVTMNIPVQNFLVKNFTKSNNGVVAIIEICLFTILAGSFARWAEPIVLLWLEESTEVVVDTLFSFWG